MMFPGCESSVTTDPPASGPMLCPLLDQLKLSYSTYESEEMRSFQNLH